MAFLLSSMTYIHTYIHTHTPQSLEQQQSPYPDYRLVLATIIGDYLFRCPNQLFASMASQTNSSVYVLDIVVMLL